MFQDQTEKRVMPNDNMNTKVLGKRIRLLKNSKYGYISYIIWFVSTSQIAS